MENTAQNSVSPVMIRVDIAGCICDYQVAAWPDASWPLLSLHTTTWTWNRQLVKF